MLLASYGAIANTITVCETCSVKTITEALTLAVDGDTILVKKGVYKEANI